MADRASRSFPLGKYQPIAELGRGGMAQVFLALSSGPAGFNKLVVIKQIHEERVGDEDFLRMFLDEARLAARLNHPNVVQTNEVGSDRGRYFLCMEYLEGQPLNRVLSRMRSPDREQPDKLLLTRGMLVRMMVDALAGLHYAHELHDFDGKPLAVVHRDVSPHNVFLTYSGQVKVVDFGIAKVLSSSVETQTGVLKGKIGYMAPEQARGERVDRRADVFSMGMVLWESLTVRKMFRGIPDIAVLQKVLSGDFPLPSTVAPDVPKRLEAACMKALATDPAARFPTAADFAAELEAALDELDRGSIRDAGRLIEKEFEADRARIKALLESELARGGILSEAMFDSSRTTGTGLPRIEWSGVADPATRPEGRPASEESAPFTPIVPPGSGAVSASGEVGPSSLTANITAKSPTPTRKSRLVLAVAGLVGAAAAFGLFFATSSTKPTPPPATSASAAAAARVLRLESTPTGAFVSEGGVVIGETPLTIPLPPPNGVRRLILSHEGYAPSTVEQASSTEDVRVVVSLVPAKASAPSAEPQKSEPETAETAKAPRTKPAAPRAPAPASTPKPQSPPLDINMQR